MTLTSSARSLLAAWKPASSQQRLLREQFLQHVNGCDEPWSRTTLPDHLTASVIVLDEGRTSVLLALHRKVGRWLQFGGHIEPHDDSIAAAARREAVEESGIPGLVLVDAEPLQLDRHAAPCGPSARFHLDIQFMAVAPRHAEPACSPESQAVQWFPVKALPEDTDDAVRSLVAAAL